MGAAALAVGIDVGGTSVKGGLVDLDTGQLASAFIRTPTPVPAIIGDVVTAITTVARQLGACGDQAGSAAMRLGIALSGDVRDGRHTTGVNLHDSWVGAPARDLLQAAIGRPLMILNDVDAAGLGEARHGAARGVPGVVVLIAFGTGIGSAILLDGQLLPNTGLGQLPFLGRPVEQLISAVARERRGLSWQGWAMEVNDYLTLVDELLRPDLIILGGGITEARSAFWDLLRSPCPLVPAALGTRAGIVGAALAADASERTAEGPSHAQQSIG